MYKVCASINDVGYRKVLLDENFQFTADSLLAATNLYTKLIWLCSPNNPTGNSLDRKEIAKLLTSFEGIVVLDEAYIDFASEGSFSEFLSQYPNLVILQTFSKAWGSAAIRLGMAFASTEIIAILNKIKYPYNVNILTQKQALSALKNADQTRAWVKTLLTERTVLVQELERLPLVQHIYPTDANFVLVKVPDANALYHYLVDKSIIVRNRNTVSLCMGCVRITVGTPEENRILLDELKNFQ
jgi:histidinol-phosphate aminotransferase